MTYYRPQWTCGRYDKHANVALYYNLIEGISYFFEDYSALVIGTILSIGRNTSITVEELSKQTDIAIDSLTPFLEELKDLHLLAIKQVTTDEIAAYRGVVSAYKCRLSQEGKKNVQEKLPYGISSAEAAYTDRVGGITSVMFELTYNCSEKCIHCYNVGATRNDQEISQRGNRKELTLEDYKRIIDELYEEGLVKVCLSGGDPFSKPIIWEVIDYLYQKDIAFDIFANGQQLIGFVSRLADYYPRLVGVSIYSGIARDHDYITRVNGSWAKSMTVVKQLSELSVPLQLKCCVMQTNVKSYYMVADIAKQYGAVFQFEVALTDSVEGDKCVSRYLRLTPNMLEIVLRDSNIPLYVGKEVPNYGGQTKPLNKNACGAAYNSFCISPEGNLLPCCSFHAPFGNLKAQTLTQILQESEELKWWRSLTLSQYRDCGKHDYCGYCNLCPGNNFSEFGTPLKAAETNCYIAKNRYELACKMAKGYDPLDNKTLQDCLDSLSIHRVELLKREYSSNYNDKSLKVGG